MKKLIALFLLLAGVIVFAFTSREINQPVPEAQPVEEIRLNVVSPSPTSVSIVSPVPADPLVLIVNTYRVERGLSPFIYNPALAVAAQKRAQYLVENQQWSHEKFVEHLHDAGFYVGAENLAQNFTSDEAIVEAWSLSKSHAELMFSSIYHYAGVGRSGNLVVLWMSANQKGGEK